MVLLALGVAAVALFDALTAIPPAGVSFNEEGIVDWVLPGGAAWELGARPGQFVTSVDVGDEPGDWHLVTASSGVARDLTAAAMVARLRATIPAAMLALMLAALAGALLAVPGPSAGALAAIAVVVARDPLSAGGDLLTSSGAMMLAIAAPAAWLLAWSGRARVAPAFGVAIGALLIAWLGLRFTAASDPDQAEVHGLFSSLAVLTTVVLASAVAAIVAVGAVRARRGGYDTAHQGDAVVIGAVAIAIPTLLASGAPIVGVAIAALCLATLYPLTRRRIWAMLDRLILDSFRRQSSILAVEQERQRMSHEIHDRPLQDLAVVIGRISLRPDLAKETDILNQVSGQLRGVTMQLHPPILTDLGLGPSLRYLVDEASDGTSAGVTLTLAAIPPEGRPPAEVELAAFRIAQEALTNAMRHSAARTISIQATISGTRIELAVIDDGVGLDDIAVSLAPSRGHVGLRTMSERAMLAGGALRIVPMRPGTRVWFRWPA